MHYFIILPLEITVIICSKCGENRLRIIERSDILDVELSNQNFWNLLIKLKMPELDFRYIPECKYNYKGKSNMIAVTNYISLHRVYLRSKKNLATVKYGIKKGEHVKYKDSYNISCFRDASVITLEYTKTILNRHEKDRICLMFDDKRPGLPEVTVMTTLENKCYIKIGNTTTPKVAYEDLLNISMHVFCHTDTFFRYQ